MIKVGEDDAYDDRVTAEQRDAINSGHQFTNIIAGPGTGKTYCLGHRIAHKIRNGTDPSRILAASFTNEACAALRAQLYGLMGDATNDIDIFTFHSFSRHLIERERQIASPGAPALVVADDWDAKTLVKGLSPDLTVKMIRSMKYSELQNLAVFGDYLHKLEKHDMVDFRSLVILAQDLAEKIAPDYDHIFVDEFQDTSRDQYTILRRMLNANPALEITVVGDPNQAIYVFNEPLFSPFREFEGLRPTPQPFYLRGNFRSTQQLVDFTNTQMPIAYPQVSTRLEVMDPPSLCLDRDSREAMPFAADTRLVSEIQRVRDRFGSVAVLVYTNKAVAHVIELLKAAKIPYEYGFNKAMVDHKNSRLVYLLFRYVTQKREIQLISLLDQSGILSKSARTQLEDLTKGFTLPIVDAFPHLKRIKDQVLLERVGKVLGEVVEELEAATDPGSVRENVGRLLKEIPGASSSNTHVNRLLDTLEVHSQYLDSSLPLVSQFMSNQLPLLSDTAQEESLPVQVRTIHSSKGHEWPAVILPYLGKEDGFRFYQPQPNDPMYRKALYVGMSRARDSLSLVASGFTPLVFNPTLKAPGVSYLSERVRARETFPKLFSPLAFKRGGPLGPLSLKRGMHRLLRLIY